MTNQPSVGIFVAQIDKRAWYVVATVVVVLLLAWFGGAEPLAPAPTTPPR